MNFFHYFTRSQNINFYIFIIYDRWSAKEEWKRCRQTPNTLYNSIEDATNAGKKWNDKYGKQDHTSYCQHKLEIICISGTGTVSGTNLISHVYTI